MPSRALNQFKRTIVRDTELINFDDSSIEIIKNLDDTIHSIREVEKISLEEICSGIPILSKKKSRNNIYTQSALAKGLTVDYYARRLRREITDNVLFKKFEKKKDKKSGKMKWYPTPLYIEWDEKLKKGDPEHGIPTFTGCEFGDPKPIQQMDALEIAIREEGERVMKSKPSQDLKTQKYLELFFIEKQSVRRIEELVKGTEFELKKTQINDRILKWCKENLEICKPKRTKKGYPRYEFYTSVHKKLYSLTDRNVDKVNYSDHLQIHKELWSKGWLGILLDFEEKILNYKYLKELGFPFSENGLREFVFHKKNCSTAQKIIIFLNAWKESGESPPTVSNIMNCIEDFSSEYREDIMTGQVL